MVPSSDFGEANKEANPNLDGGCCTDLLDTVMDQTTDTFSCPPKLGGGNGGSATAKDGANKADDNDDSAHSRDLDQELEDLDINYDMFDSAASLKSIDGVGNDSQGQGGDDNNTKDTDKMTRKEKKMAQKQQKVKDVVSTEEEAAAKKAGTSKAHLKESRLNQSASSTSSASSETKWDKRANRPHLFETSYTALRTEDYEVAMLAASLGVPKPTRFGVPGRTVARLSPLLFPKAGEMRAILMRQGRKVPIFETTILDVANHPDLKTFANIDPELVHVNHVHLLTNSIIFSRNVAGAAAAEAQRHSSSNPTATAKKDTSIESISEDGPSLHEMPSELAGGSRPSLISPSGDGGGGGNTLQQGSFRQFTSARQESFRTMVQGTNRLAGDIAQGTAKFVKDTGTRMTKHNGPKAERMSALTAVLDMEFWPLSVALSPGELQNKGHDDDEEDDEEKVDDSFEDLKEANAPADDTSICLVFDSARLYFLTLRDALEKEQWLTSIGACVAGNISAAMEESAKPKSKRNVKQDEHEPTAADVLAEKANRVHQVMQTSLYSAALCGKAGVIEQYVASSKDLVNDTDEFGHTAAYYAVQQGHNVCLSVLLDAGADPNGMIDSNAEDKRSLASYALEKENMRALEMLEANGATLNDAEKEKLESLTAEPVVEGELEYDDDNDNDNNPSSANSNATGAMSEAMAQLNERGDKLNELQDKTADLQNETGTYLDLAKQMKQKAKRDQNRKIFGIF